MMRQIKYTIPIFITAVFLLLVSLKQWYFFIPILTVANLMNIVLGKFTKHELLEELKFYYSDRKLNTIKVVSMLFFICANLLFFWLMGNFLFSTFSIIYFGLVFGILNCSFLLALSHEFLHEKSILKKVLANLGLYIIAIPFFGNDHIYGHHNKVCTTEDKTSAYLGLSFYKYLINASFYRLKESYLAINNYPENSKKKILVINIINAFINIIIIACLAFIFKFRFQFLVFFVTQAFVTYLMYEISNYVQHYGLSRKKDSEGNYEPFKLNNAWNYTHKYTNYITFFVPIHSYHHVHKFNYDHQNSGQVDEQLPVLPYSYFIMMLIALIPPLWHKIMDKRCRKILQIGFIIVLLSFPMQSKAQVTYRKNNFGIKYFGFSIHPKGDKQAHLMPYKLDKNGVFILNFGTIVSYQHNVYKDLISVKIAQGFYSDSGGLPSGHTHIGFRIMCLEKNKHSLLFGFGPTLVYRKNWNCKPGYVTTGLFKEYKNIQYKFVWYGGEIEYNYKLNDKIDLNANFLPGYPLIMSFGFGMRMWLN